MAETQSNNEQDNTISADIEGLESFLDEFEEASSAVAGEGPLDLELGGIPELNEIAVESSRFHDLEEEVSGESSDELSGVDLADLNLAIDSSPPINDALSRPTAVLSSTDPICTPGHDNLSIVAFVVAAFALSASGLMAWWAGDLSDQLTTVRAQLVSVNQKTGQGSTTGAPDLAMLAQLNERMTELSVVVEGPVSHLLENNKRDMSDLHSRLDEMERALASKQKPLAMVATPPVVVDNQSKEPASGWMVNLVSFPRPAAADSELLKLSRAGIEAEKFQVKSKNVTWYRIRVTGFDSRQAAQSYVNGEALKAGYKQAWISRF